MDMYRRRRPPQSPNHMSFPRGAGARPPLGGAGGVSGSPASSPSALRRVASGGAVAALSGRRTPSATSLAAGGASGGATPVAASGGATPVAGGTPPIDAERWC